MRLRTRTSGSTAAEGGAESYAVFVARAIESTTREIRSAQARADARADRTFNRNRSDIRFAVGDHVLVYVDGVDGSSRISKLSPRWRGPYQVVSVDNDVMYSLRPLLGGRVITRHAMLLQPWTTTPESLPTWAQLQHEWRDGEFDIERVTAHRTDAAGLSFHVVWAGFPESQASWLAASLALASSVVVDYARVHDIDLHDVARLRRIRLRADAPAADGPRPSRLARATQLLSVHGSLTGVGGLFASSF